MNAIEVMRERGFIDQTTNDEELDKLFQNEKVTCYIGFDPTASSLHVGSLVPIMALAHMQRQGNRPIALVGGGTGLVGDPSGKTEMRQMLTADKINENSMGIKAQLSRFLDFSEGGALLLNNADWLSEIKYIPFLRDIGRHFSVNRMIKAESYRMRLESDEGLSFIEFNYMLLQAYDFLVLSDRYGCLLQMGGSDQWGNIVAGIELVRRARQTSAYGITFPLITTSSGAKMGKTAQGAVWLDAKRTSPYDYYQYWVNTDDADVARFLALFTFLPMEEVRAVEKLQGADLNAAKAVLAYETTRLVHGREAAEQAFYAASVMFGNRIVPGGLLASSDIPRAADATESGAVPQTDMNVDDLADGIPVYKLFHMIGLAKSGGAAKRLIQQGGGYLNNERVASEDYMVSRRDAVGGEMLLRAGKKRFHKINIVEK